MRFSDTAVEGVGAKKNEKNSSRLSTKKGHFLPNYCFINLPIFKIKVWKNVHNNDV